MKFEDVNISTDRLVIRRVQDGDLDALYAIYSDAETMKYWSTPAVTERDQVRLKIKDIKTAHDAGQSMGLAVTLKSSDVLIGQVSLFNFHETSKRAELGYILSRKHWQHGYMYEAVQACIDYCFKVLDLRRLEADIDPNNVASAGLLQKLGFEKEGLLLQRWIVNDQVSDSELYGLLRKPIH